MLHILQRLVADKAHFMIFNSSYTHQSTHVQIKLSVKGTEIEIKEDGMDGPEAVLEAAYARYLKLTDTMPELVPHRLSYVVTEDSDEVTKTEPYTPFKEVNSNEVPF